MEGLYVCCHKKNHLYKIEYIDKDQLYILLVLLRMDPDDNIWLVRSKANYNRMRMLKLATYLLKLTNKHLLYSIAKYL
jgi:hypothetical protein